MGIFALVITYSCQGACNYIKKAAGEIAKGVDGCVPADKVAMAKGYADMAMSKIGCRRRLAERRMKVCPDGVKSLVDMASGKIIGLLNDKLKSLGLGDTSKIANCIWGKGAPFVK